MTERRIDMVNAYNTMKIIIKSKKKSREYCEGKLNTFYAVDALTDDQYNELVVLVNELYGEE